MEYKIKTRCTYDYIKHAQHRHSFLLIVDCPTTMVKNARCAVGYYNYDKCYPELQVKCSHVETRVFHKWPKDPGLAETWRKQMAKSRSDKSKPTPGAQGTFVCSNHFPMGKKTPNDPKTDYPSVFMTM